MLRKFIFLCLLGALLTACNGESPTTTQISPVVEQPATEAPATAENPAITSEAPPIDSTPIMIEPLEQRAPKPINSEYLPQREDSNLTQENMFIDHSELLIMESYPIQISLALQGSLPTPCNQLRVIASPPDEQNRIQVDVYSVIDPDQVCTQVLEPFEVNVGLGSFQAGHYTVWVNGESAGEFDA
jgi:hypothetical protein